MATPRAILTRCAGAENIIVHTEVPPLCGDYPRRSCIAVSRCDHATLLLIKMNDTPA